MVHNLPQCSILPMVLPHDERLMLRWRGAAYEKEEAQAMSDGIEVKQQVTINRPAE